MCGINLVLNNSTQGEKAIQRMMKKTHHRGPDHAAWQNAADGIFVAGNRLKVFDLGNEGNQPVRTQDGEAILVWNGALYNCQDLRNQLLEIGVDFRSGTDSEVLIHWLRIYGEKGVKHLHGMFAFVFVDKKKKMVMVSRDPYGKKPLYVHQNEDRWLISSEARAIAHSGLVGKKLDTSQYLPYFYSRHTFPERTFFEGIRQVLPGEVLVFDFAGLLQDRFLQQPTHENVNFPNTGEFREMVLNSVLRQFDAEVPVGIILSGGADSSLLLHTWYKETSVPLHTFTAIFDRKYLRKFKDPKYASQIAGKYHCAHHEILVTPEVVLTNWEEYISSLDQPVGDSASFLTWIIAREAKKFVKVLVSGAGADELFSGYSRHRAFRHYLKNPGLFRFISNGTGFLPFLPRGIRKMLKSIADTDEETYLNFSSLQAIPQYLRKHFLAYYPKDASSYKAALIWDRQYYLVNDILKIHDNATMAHGIEGRAPFMDKSMVDLSHFMSEEQHLQLKPKHWIREILKAEGLGNISRRKKLGFGLPLKAWLQTEKDFREKIFLTISAFAADSGKDFPEEMRNLALKPAEQVEESFLQIWNLFILASWKKKQGL